VSNDLITAIGEVARRTAQKCGFEWCSTSVEFSAAEDCYLLTMKLGETFQWVKAMRITSEEFKRADAKLRADIVEWAQAACFDVWGADL
jgi:hypothetical protein